MGTQSHQQARRLFFALWPDEATRASLAHATRRAVRSCGGRPVAVHNLHATLLFLGRVEESRVAEVVAIGAHAAAGAAAAVVGAAGTAADAAAAGVTAVAGIASPLAVDSSSPGFVFERVAFWEKAHVLVATPGVAAGAGDALAGALVGMLQRETLSAGFELDLKPFRPHVTLARKVAFLKTTLAMQPVSWAFADFALVESRTDPDGPVYTVLESYPLVSGDRRSSV